MKSQSRQGRRGSVELPQAPDSEAFSRLELATVLGALGLLAVLVLPALANQRERSTRVQCVNNLRVIGQAFQQWGTEHNGQIPFRTPWCEGGLQPTPCLGDIPPRPLPLWVAPGFYGYNWFNFAWLSNELRNPKILVCPSDVQKQPASRFDASPDGGFVNARYANRAVSYFTALDVFPADPDGLVTGDRNVRFNVVGGTICSFGVVCEGLNASSSFGIGAGLHVEAGNYLFKDGRVEELSSDGLFKRWVSIYGDRRETHYLIP